MEDSNGKNSENITLPSLIQAFLIENLPISDFRISISNFSEEITIFHFRELFSKFYDILLEKMLDTFRRYFFNNKQIEENEFYGYAQYKYFWVELKNLHDSYKFLSMTYPEILTYLKERNIDDQSAINYLLEGTIDPETFRISRVTNSSKIKLTNIFRDSFPKFSSWINSRITATFQKYFFQDSKIEPNEFYQFAEKSTFWQELRHFHWYIYNQDMHFKDVLEYFLTYFNIHKHELSFTKQEKRMLLVLSNNPNSSNKEIAKEIGCSEKDVIRLLQNLRSNNICLESLISYKSLNFHEFFSNDSTVRPDKFTFLFHKYIMPYGNDFIHGITTQKKFGSGFYYVKEKKVFTNPEVLFRGLLLKNWIENGHTLPNSHCFSVSKPSPKSYSLEHNRYIPHLFRSCEFDFNKPYTKTIEDKYNVSSSELLNLKSNLVKENVIQPHLVIEHPALLQLFIVSKLELTDFYNKVPYIKGYDIRDVFGDSNWFYFLSVFRADYEHISSNLRYLKADTFEMKRQKIINDDEFGPPSLPEIHR